MFNLENQWIDVECPNCRYRIDTQMIDVKTQKQIFCHNCKASINLVDSQASVHSGIEIINNSIKELENIFKNFGK